jgi:hypothetical protein
LFQGVFVGHLDETPAIRDNARLLERFGHQRDRGAPQSQQHRETLMRHGNRLAILPSVQVQQALAETGFDIVFYVAGERLLAARKNEIRIPRKKHCDTVVALE